MTGALLVLLAGLAAAGVSPRTAASLQRELASGGGPPGLSRECREFIAALPPDADAAFLTVPRDWRSRAGEVRLFHWGRFSGDGTPVALVNGGPGAPGWRMWRERLPEGRALAGRPVVFFDQRGTGCSTPYPARPDGSWASDSIVRDMEAIRSSLFGARPWKVFGQSYGSVVVHRYAMLAPGGLAAGYAHGFALLGDPRAYRRVHRERGLELLRRWYAERPGERERLHAALDLLAARDCPAATTDEAKSACVEPYASTLSGLVRDPAAWPRASEEVSRLAALPPRPATAAASEGPLDASAAAIHTIVAQEYLAPGYDPKDPFACRDAVAELRRTSDWRDLAPFAACDAYGGAKLELYAANRDLASGDLSLASFAEALRANPAVKFRLYSGEYDPHSPPPYFTDEARVLEGRISYRLIPGGGHFDWEPVLEDIRAD